MIQTHRHFAIERLLILALMLCLVLYTDAAVNMPPIAYPDSYTTNEDTTLSIPAPGVLANDSDPDDSLSSLRPVLISSTTNGILTLTTSGSSSGAFTYRPSTNFFGTDAFVYSTRDGSSTSAPVTVTITINPINDVPIATNNSYSVASDDVLVVTGNGVLENDGDADGDALTALLVSSVTHGALLLNANGSFIYTPATNYSGADSFTYRARDAVSTSGVATVNIAVTPVPITIVTPPANQSVCLADTVTFSVAAMGTAVTYQWRKNGSALGGKTNSTLILSNVTAADAATYSVKMTNIVSNLTNSATLAVNTPVAATALTNQVRYLGSLASFSTTASGSGPFAYQWLKDNVLISGETNRSLTLSNTALSDTATYSVVVSGACRSVTNSATLLVSYCFNSLDVMLVIDRSASMIGVPYADAKTAATNFVRSLLLSTNVDYVGLVSFNPNSTLNRILTNSRVAIEQSIATLPAAGGGTCISCGLNDAQAELSSIRHRAGALPVMVILTDGVPKVQDGDSPSNVVYFAQIAKNSGVRVFTLGLNDGSGTNVDKTLLANAASSTNDFFYATSSSQLTAVFDAISTVLCRGPAHVVGPERNNVVACAGTFVNFEVNASGCYEFFYQWSKDGVPLADKTNSILSLATVSASDAGAYSVVVTSPCGNVTNSATLTVNPSLQISAGPTDLSLCPGEDASFHIDATGTALTYQWLKDGIVLPDQTNSTVLLSNVTTNDAGFYSVSILSTCGNSSTNGAALLVTAPPNVTAAPESLVRCAGDFAVFSVSTSNQGLSFQWFKDAVVLPGETFSVLNLGPVEADDAGIYSVVISNRCGTVTTSAELVVNRLAGIVVGPMSLTQCTGDSASFTVLASGSYVTYQWRKGFETLVDETNNVLTLTNLSASDAGIYVVTVSDVCGTSISTSGQLDVNTLPILTPLLNTTSCPNSLVTFQVTAGGTGPFTYLWRKNGEAIDNEFGSTLSLGNATEAKSGTYSVEVTGACGTATNTAELFVPANPTATSLTSLTRCEGQSAVFTSDVAGTAPLTLVWRKNGVVIPGETNGTLSFAQVTPNDSGTYILEVSGLCLTQTVSATLTVNALVTATPLPNIAACMGDPVTLSTVVSGTGPFTFVWRNFGQVIPNATNASLVFLHVSLADVGFYAVEVYGACNAVTNLGALLVLAPTTATPLANAVRCVGESVTFSSVANGSAPLVFAWRKNGVLLPSEITSSFSISTVSTNDAGVYALEVSGPCGTVTNTATLVVPVPITEVHLTDLAVCLGTAASFNANPDGTGPFNFVWRKSGTVLEGQTNSILSISAVTNESAGIYTVEVSSACNSVTNSAALTVLVPTTATPLVDAIRCVGDGVTFSSTVQAAGVFFQWRKDGVLLPAETNSAFSLSSVTTNDSGVYALEIVGACGGLTNSARLTVRELISATPMSDVVVCALSPVFFSTAVTGTGPFSFVWRKDGILLDGQTNATLSIASATNGAAGVYTLEISAPCNSITNAAALSVPASITATPLGDAIRCVGESVTFSSVAAGAAPLSFTWRKGGVLIANQTNSTLSLTNISATDAGNYSLEVFSACGSVTNNAVLTVRALTAGTALTDASICAGTPISFTTVPSGTAPFVFLWRKNGAALENQTNATLSISAATTNDAGIYSVEVSGACNSVTNSAVLSVLATTTASPLVNAIRCVGESVNFSSVASGATSISFAWCKDGTLLAAETNSTLNLTNISLTDAGTYSLEVSGACGRVTNSAVLTVRALTTATTLADASVCAGSSALFSTAPSGTGPFAILWRKNGAALQDQTNATLSISAATTNDAGIYTVEVSGTCNSVTNSAVLAVLAATIATPLTDSIVCAGESVTFGSVVTGVQPLALVWRKNGVLIESAITSTLSLTNVSTNDAGIYSLEVSGPCGRVTNSALLMVRELVTATVLVDTVACVGQPFLFTTVPNGTGLFTFVWRKDGNVLDGETNGNLSVASATNGSAGAYSVEVSGACNSVTNSATLVVQTLVTASVLSNAIVCPGEPVMFTVTAEGTGPFTFIWRKDGAVVGGLADPAFSIPHATLADAGTYAVEVHGACSFAISSATLVVREALASTSLVNATRCAGENVTFSAIASGTLPISFTWRKNGALLPLETNSSLTLVNLTTNDAGNYSVEIVGPCNAVTNSATLVVNQSITATPLVNVIACEGGNAIFSSTIGGTGPFSFIWRKSGVLIPNETNATLSLTAVTAASSGIYTLEANGMCRTITNSASLIVAALPTALTNASRCAGDSAIFSTTVSGGLPYVFVWRKDGALLNGQTNHNLVLTNVQLADAGIYSVEINGGCVAVTNSAVLTVPLTTSLSPMASQSQCAGSTINFIATASGTGPFQYLWRKAGSAIAGATNSSLSLTNITLADVAEYAIEATGACGSATNRATLTVNTVPTVTGLTDMLTCYGQDVLLTASVGGGGTYTKVWRKDGVVLDAETNATLLITGINAAKAGLFTFEVSGTCGSVTQSSTITVATNLTVDPLASLSRNAGSSVTFTALVSGAAPISFTWKKGSGVIANATSNTLTLSNLTAADAGGYSVEVRGPCNTASAQGSLIVVTEATAASPLQNSSACAGQTAIFSTSATGCGEPFAFVWRKDGQVLAGQTNNTLTILNCALTNAGTYSVEVIGCNRVTNSAQLTVNAPLSATMPAQQTACSCSDVVLGPMVNTGTGPVTCVWRKDGVILEGQTNLALNLQKLNTASSGTYTAELTGPCNRVTNSTVLEIINPTSGVWPNTNAVVIPEFGAASPYPSTVLVRCAPVPVTELRVTLFGLSHSFPDDLDIVLVAPNNMAVKLMSDAGGGGANVLNDVTLTFDSASVNSLPDSGQILSGTYRPSDYNGLDGDTFPAPAPSSTSNLSLGALYGSNPNGTWSLYIVDDHGRDGGSMKGWSLDFGQSGFVFPDVALTNPEMNPDGSFTMQLHGSVDKSYFLEASADLIQWTIIQTNQMSAPSMTIIDRTAPQFNYRFYRASGCRE